jgi:metal-responsive CopG/Arc/MetJ family transcriptional regulator
MANRQPTKPRRTKTVTIELPPEVLAAIDQKAEEELITRSALCRQLLAKAVRQMVG